MYVFIIKIAERFWGFNYSLSKTSKKARLICGFILFFTNAQSGYHNKQIKQCINH